MHKNQIVIYYKHLQREKNSQHAIVELQSNNCSHVIETVAWLVSPTQKRPFNKLYTDRHRLAQTQNQSFNQQ